MNILIYLQSLIVYLDIYLFWFPNQKYQNYWFSNEKDNIIKKRYNNFVEYLSRLSVQQLVEIVELFHITDQNIIIISIIICLDQFTRNIYRNDMKQRIKNDRLCLQFTLYYYLQNRHRQFPINERIFFLLPLRHRRSTTLAYIVLNEIEIMQKQVENKIQQSIVNRFRKATLKGISIHTDTIQLIHSINSDEKYLENVPLDILAPICQGYSLNPLQLVNINNTKLYKVITKYIKRHKLRKICISLSGGVDSMVICYIINYMLRQNIIDHICAVHVDYGNRDVSRNESLFVQQWCRYFNIPLLVRRIDHIKRNSEIDRDLYETETKNIRFNLYKEACNRYKCQCILLGHHKDDLAENVFMNVIRNNDILNLPILIKDKIANYDRINNY